MEKIRFDHEMSFFENRRNCSPSELYGGGPFIKFNSYSFNFNGGLRKHRAGYCLLRTPGPRGKQFLRFLKTDLLRFHGIYLLFDWIKLLFFYLICVQIWIILMPWILVNVTLKKWCFFWRSVYISPCTGLLLLISMLTTHFHQINLIWEYIRCGSLTSLLRALSPYIFKITVAPENWFTHFCILTQAPCYAYGECAYTHNVHEPAPQQHWGNMRVQVCVTSWLLQWIRC